MIKPKILSEKKIRKVIYDAELELEDLYSRHENCRDKYNCSPLEFLSMRGREAQRDKDTEYYEEVMRKKTLWDRFFPW